MQLHSASWRVREIENVSAFKNQVWGACNSIWERHPVIKIHFGHILWLVIEGRLGWGRGGEFKESGRERKQTQKQAARSEEKIKTERKRHTQRECKQQIHLQRSTEKET